MATAAVVSFRLGGTDGVAVEAAKWSWALSELGFSVLTIAGEGRAERIVEGLGMGAGPPERAELDRALSDADVVVVENLCSLPLNAGAARVLQAVLAGRPAILHHHDLPWQRPHLGVAGAPPTDPAWIHVTTNDLSRRELAERRIEATTVHNCFDTRARAGDREHTRRALGVAEGELVVLQPTRAIERKNVPGGIALAEELHATFWLLGPAEDGYAGALSEIVAGAATRVLRGPCRGGEGSEVADAYAACDVVALPSTWEGFGNPSVESAVHGKPLAIGEYPVAHELAAFGFEWFDARAPGPLARWLESPDRRLIERNLAVARRHFDLRDLPHRIDRLMRKSGWRWV